MSALRRLLLTHRALAVLAITAAMLLRVLVPAGFMPVSAGSGIVLAVCPGTSAASMDHMGGHHDPAPRAESPCAFADLALPIVGGVDPVLLLAAIAFVVALGTAAAAAFRLAAAARARPPSQAPPALA